MSSSSSSRQLHLGLLLGATGVHMASWRHPDVPAHAATDFSHYLALARTAEQAGFDTLFLADTSPSWDGTGLDVLSLSEPPRHLEPITLLSALAVHTRHIGLVGSVSTSFQEPYHVARQFASLDHLSGGRAGWNVVTSLELSEARNFSREAHLDHARRYERAREFVQVARGLWDSWDDDAFVRDQASGRYFEPSRLHLLGHRGPHFTVQGPLNVPRPPQGHPILAQAGSSDDGKDLGAQVADLIFTAQRTLDEGQRFYADLKARATLAGRDPDHIKVLPGLAPLAGTTRQAAQDQFEQLQALILPEVGVAQLSRYFGSDLARYDIDGPFPELPPTDGHQARAQLIQDLARREQLTIRQVYQRTVGAAGHPTVIGTAADIADHMQHWLETQAADGFIIMPPTMPAALDGFTSLVVPELQRRGLFRRAYEAQTLRGHLGLARPTGRRGTN